MSAALEVEQLSATLGGVPLVDAVSFQLLPGRLHALIGESGSGKSMTALALTRLVPEGITLSGRVRLGGVELPPLPKAQMREVLGRGVSLMLQEPLAALNPVLTVQSHLVEALQAHQALPKAQAIERAAKLLNEVGLSDEKRVLASYPHQLSGGMRQRVLLGAALAGEPKVLIADEPTTALDASVRGVVLDLLRALAHRRGLAVLLLTHDLGVVQRACDEMSVMYAGRIVEHGTVSSVMSHPQHPYTAALLRARPTNVERGQRLDALEGTVPLPSERIEGCRFRPRCPFNDGACLLRPELKSGVACHHPRGGLR